MSRVQGLPERARGCPGSSFSRLGRGGFLRQAISPFVHQGIEPLHQLLHLLLVAEQVLGDQQPLLGGGHVLQPLLPRVLDFDLPPRRLAQRRLEHVDELVAHVGIQLGGLPDLLQRELQLLRGRVRIRAHQRPGLAERVLHLGLDHLAMTRRRAGSFRPWRPAGGSAAAGTDQVQVGRRRRPPATARRRWQPGSRSGCGDARRRRRPPDASPAPS